MTTIRQVARLAGVSTATVSHVLNGTRSVSEQLRERVLVATDRLQYQPNVVARSLRRRQTLTLGLMLPDVEIPYFARVARNFERAANRAGYSVILCNSGWSLSDELEYLNELMARHVDGMLCVTFATAAEHLAPVVDRNIPVVLLERTIPGIELDAVRIDNFQGAYDATVHLLQLGHRRVGCITGLDNSQLSEDRLAGYRQALLDWGVEFAPELLRVGDYTVDTGVSQGRALIAELRPPSAIFAFNDMMALGAIQVLNECGLRVPDDIAVIGFDGVPLTAHTTPPLSTVEQPVPEMCDLALDLLLNRISGEAPAEPRVIVAIPQLVARASTVGFRTQQPAPAYAEIGVHVGTGV